MASLTLRTQDLEMEGPRGRKNHASYRRPSRLPTPETSLDSYHSFDSTEADAAPRSMDSRHALDEWEFWRNSSCRRDSHVALPNSPPYDPPESQRPSLPPIKMMLGEVMSSPPETPIPGSISLQPLPREPAVAADTYKPPSLYPNKKPRTNWVLEPVAPITDPYAFSSRRQQQDARTVDHVRLYPTAETLRRSSHHHDSFSSARQYSNDGCEPSPDSAKPPTRIPSSSIQYRVPTLQRFERHRQNHVSPQLAYVAPYGPRACEGSDAYVSPRAYRSYHTGPRLSSASDSTSRDQIVMHQMSRESPYEWGDAPDTRSDPHSSYFTPNHYDYKHGKTRKRSNLPKQSTEIMKTWFDKNISNPYPTEEQKAMFSNVTGISMTQVSNWFINHRRRCPELRDKRDRSRGGEYDM